MRHFIIRFGWLILIYLFSFFLPVIFTGLDFPDDKRQYGIMNDEEKTLLNFYEDIQEVKKEIERWLMSIVTVK